MGATRKPYSTVEQREQWLRKQPKYLHIFRDHKEVSNRERKEIFKDLKRAGLIAPSTYYLDVRHLTVSVR